MTVATGQPELQNSAPERVPESNIVREGLVGNPRKICDMQWKQKTEILGVRKWEREFLRHASLETSFVGGQGSIPGSCALQQDTTRNRIKFQEQKRETPPETEGDTGNENE
jgi:hypothetical protein